MPTWNTAPNRVLQCHHGFNILLAWNKQARTHHLMISLIMMFPEDSGKS